MYDFETLVQEVLKNRPELDRAGLMEKIEEKKRTVGAGYLTNQGALFLVAAELGVALQQATSSDLTLKDLYVGANDVTVVARVLGVYPVSTFNKKDGGEGRYLRLALFDKDRSVRMTVWEEGVDEVGKLGLGVDSPVRVVGGYVKQGLDGKPNLNLGKRGRMELITDEKTVSKLVPLDGLAEKLTKITEERPFIAIDCVSASEPRYSEFVRSDGSKGSLFQFSVKGRGSKEEYRVVIWSPGDRPDIPPGTKLRITNVRTRRSSRGEVEIHGDGGTAIIMDRKREKTTMRVCAKSTSSKGALLFVVGRDRKVKVVETGLDVKSIGIGDTVALSPDHESGERMTCDSPGSVEPLDEGAFPSLESLATKVKEARDESAMVMLETIALSQGISEEVSMKDGTMVRKGELVVGDDTGEVKLVAWRDLSERVSGIQPGERLRLVGVTPKSTKMGSTVLQMSAISSIERIRSR